MREAGKGEDGKCGRDLEFWTSLTGTMGLREGFRPSVQDRRPEADRTELGPRLVWPILWDRRSRFGPLDRPSVGLWTSLLLLIVDRD